MRVMDQRQEGSVVFLDGKRQDTSRTPSLCREFLLMRLPVFAIDLGQ